MTRLETALERLPRYPPERLDDSCLLRRVDTKFLYAGPLPDLAEELGGLVELLGRSYGVLHAGGRPIASYQTLYFDSPDKTYFHQHRRGERDRFKVRIRHYPDRQLSVLEVKRKTNQDVTVKTRLDKDFLDDALAASDQLFLKEHSPCDPRSLLPQVWTDFSRITLVGLEAAERLTLDLHLEFRAGRQRHRLAGLAVIEVKQPRFSPRTPAMLALRARGMRPSGVSKYCAAQVTLFPTLRDNWLRPSLRKIRRCADA